MGASIGLSGFFDQGVFPTRDIMDASAIIPTIASVIMILRLATTTKKDVIDTSAMNMLRILSIIIMLKINLLLKH